ncbi:MAG: M48 family metallopeptidase [Patescibacteria group bacterium]
MDYQLKRNSRSTKLSISLKSTGELIVTAPKLIPKFFIDKFVRDNQTWINNQKQKIKNKFKFIDQDFVYIFGKKYSLKIESTIEPSKVSLKNNELIIQLHQNNNQVITFNPQQPNPVLLRFLKNTAQHYITKKTSLMAKKMGLTYKKISFKIQKTRWGSCSSTKNLNFNLKLIHFTPKIIDYVIIHELAHLEYMDHSKNFWQLVEQYDPDYRLHRGWLKRQGSTID